MPPFYLDLAHLRYCGDSLPDDLAGYGGAYRRSPILRATSGSSDHERQQDDCDRCRFESNRGWLAVVT